MSALDAVIVWKAYTLGGGETKACSNLELMERMEGWRDGWRRRRRKLAVTNESRKRAALSADVQLALGQLILLHPPTPQPPPSLPITLKPPQTQNHRDDLDQHERSNRAAKIKHEVLLTK